MWLVVGDYSLVIFPIMAYSLRNVLSLSPNVNADAMPKALQQREESVRNGKLTSIIFIRDKNAKGQEVSGYIDYGHR